MDCHSRPQNLQGVEGGWCGIKIIRKLDEKCEKCSYVNECDEKRMVSCGMMELPQKMSNSASATMTMPVAAEILVKHNYRNIKISPTQTITVDLERSIYKALGCPAFEFGA